MSKAPTITLDEWEQALAEVNGARTDTIPKGWITTSQFSLKLNCSIPTANRKMRGLVLAGKAEETSFRIRVGSRILPVPHYRLKRK